ncbi:Polyamine oxidase, partial [Bienertia sinuspersici]
MGANWLHGVGGRMKNPLYKMSQKIHLKTSFSDFANVSYNTYKQGGGLYEDKEVKSAIRRVEEILELAQNCSRNSDDDLSILAFERLKKLEPKTMLEKMIEYFYFDGEQGEGSRVTSLKHVLPFAESYNYGDNSYFVADSRGFESLVHYIAKQFLSYHNHIVTDPRVKFNEVVIEIYQSESGVIVRTEDGNMYQARLAIVSPSLGVLQNDLIKFIPELPVGKRIAIAEFDIGVYTKIFLKFPHKFWPTGNGTEFFFYVHERRGYYAIWQHLENEYPGSNIMFVTLTDEEAIRVEQQHDKKIEEEAMNVLKEMFGENIPNPTDIMIPKWKSDRFYQGCFTNWPVGYSQERHNEL